MSTVTGVEILNRREQAITSSTSAWQRLHQVQPASGASSTSATASAEPPGVNGSRSGRQAASDRRLPNTACSTG